MSTHIGPDITHGFRSFPSSYLVGKNRNDVVGVRPRREKPEWRKVMYN